MDEGKVTLVVDVDQIVVVCVDLDWRKLTLVDNVPVAQRAEVEPVAKANNVSSALAQDKQLQLKSPLIELLHIGDFGLVALAVGRLQHHKGLQDDRLARQRSGTQNSRVARHLTPAQDAQTQGCSQFLEAGLGLLERDFVGLEEQVTDGILAQRRQLHANLTGEVLHEELVGDAGHHTSTVTVSRVGADGSTVGHVAQ